MSEGMERSKINPSGCDFTEAGKGASGAVTVEWLQGKQEFLYVWTEHAMRVYMSQLPDGKTWTRC